MPIYQHNTRNELLVASDLQRALIDTVGDCLKDLVTVNAQGEKTVGYTGYAQQLPIQVNADEDPDRFFPYFIVRLLEGNTGNAVDDDDDYWTWTVAIYLGVHDDGTGNQGHFALLNALTRITSRFGKEAVMGPPGKIGFRCLPQMKVQLQDEDTYPYFLGAVLLNFAAPKITREDPFDAYKDYDDGYHRAAEDQD